MKENLNRMLKTSNKWLLLLIMSCISISAFAQESIITGNVISQEDGLAIPGVSVVIKGTTSGTITDFDGNFSLKAKVGDILLFSFVGMKNLEQTVTSAKVNVKLEPESIGLDEVVAIGYGTQKKKEVSGAVVQVKAEALEKISTSDLGTALQGNIAGVSVQASSGAPGATANIQIRGVSSINGQNDPLWVVDGIPQSGDPGLSSSEIETIDVLKDAASCAIYGTRGAAGVILVTTKQGKAGQMKISANGYYGVQKITSGINLLNFEEYFQTHFYNKRHLNETAHSDNIWTSLENGVDNFTNNTNIVDVIENDNARIQNYSLNISGGTKDLTYNVVGSFFEQEGTLINTNYQRFNVRANTSYKKGKWSVRTGLGFRVDEQAYAAYNLLYDAYKYKPYQPEIDPNANTFSEGGQENDRLQLGNVMGKLKQTDVRNGESFNGNIDVNFEVLKGLNMTSRVGVVYGNNTRTKTNPLFEVYDEEGELVINSNTRSGIRNESNRNTSFTFEGGFNYTKKVGQHKFNFLANASVEEFKYTSFWASGKDLTSNEVPNLGQTTADFAVGIGNDWTQDKTNKLLGYLARLQYNFKDGRYNVSVSARRDGSSRFASENQWKTFPSAAASWNVADENFFQGLTSTINAFKIRASLGTTGNQSILDYSYAPTISSGYDYAIGTEQTTAIGLGSIQTGYANPEVQWETSIQKNIGFDFGFFSNKLSLNVDLYDTEKRDLLFPLLIPTAAGAGQNQSVILNVGDMRNRGVEIAAGYRHHGKFSWGVNATYTKNINEVTKMAGSNPISYFYNGYPINVSGNDDKITVIREGYEAGAFMVMETGGIINTEEKLGEYQKIEPSAKMGDLIYVDQNGDNVIDESDRVYGGSGTPEFEVGLNFNCDYKGFDFSMQWFGAFGQEIINGSRIYSFTTGTHKDLIYQWHEDNPYGVIPANRGGSHDNYRSYADIWIEDGSYIRLRNVILGYRLPKQLTGKVGISKLRIYIAADNPLTFTKYTGYDPEVGNDGLATRGLDKGNYPISSQFRAGIQLDF
ncbi:SusC/RagA family TonB-linked outer membrane protein [Saccharicrinis aurantiacus]|uniref:SusC/RagA family TonB-linked outer membrane protein n=1 Tax=Saccharicrinis aurantiacus TaxID=1849719 RepID=UPI002492DAAA|nr:TonB-dependent receptor [Saccharicrinis aurantiacus]